ncbi:MULTISPECIES: hypothetical protein [unclassified Flavobacterium]|uniref:hypothetical protein n=1 Tax=unclassified Flavobacterium TaxID=196869 RepID=UPI0025BD4EE6|nr:MULTISPECIES: hypothetical protein [unclassified Flavobacterium]
MKKTTALFLMASGLLLASCASSGWSCCKRYGSNEKVKVLKTNNPNEKPLS